MLRLLSIILVLIIIIIILKRKFLKNIENLDNKKDYCIKNSDCINENEWCVNGKCCESYIKGKGAKLPSKCKSINNTERVASECECGDELKVINDRGVDIAICNKIKN